MNALVRSIDILEPEIFYLVRLSSLYFNSGSTKQEIILVPLKSYFVVSVLTEYCPIRRHSYESQKEKDTVW